MISFCNSWFIKVRPSSTRCFKSFTGVKHSYDLPSHRCSLTGTAFIKYIPRSVSVNIGIWDDQKQLSLCVLFKYHQLTNLSLGFPWMEAFSERKMDQKLGYPCGIRGIAVRSVPHRAPLKAFYRLKKSHSHLLCTRKPFCPLDCYGCSGVLMILGDY